MANEGTIITASGRSLEEMKAGIRIRMQSMVNSALEIGLDLAEAKEACRHGEWMPFLKDIGLSASTAANYMRIAREVAADSRMAGLPYTKILALLSAPPEEREELAAAAEDMSAAEIRRLTEERNRAAEAANAETARANQAEEDAKMFGQEAAGLRVQIQNLRAKLEKAEKETHQARCDLTKSSEAYERQKKRIDDLREENARLCSEIDEMADNPAETQLLNAIIEIDELKAALKDAQERTVEVEVEVEKAPADYDQLKRDQQDLIAAAAEAEQRAADAEAELEVLRSGNGQKMEKPVGIILGQAMNAFFSACEMMPFNPAELQRDSYAVRHCIGQIHEWCLRMEDALAAPVITEARVI